MKFDEIAQAIRAARTTAGLTQKQVAEALDKSQTTVAAWEIGRSQPDAKTIVSLSKFFGVSADYLLGLSGFRTSGAEDTLTAMFGVKVEALTAEERDSISSFLESLADLCNQILEENSEVLLPALACTSSVIQVIKEIVALFSLYKAGYAMANSFDQIKDVLEPLSNDERRSILSAVSTSGPILDAFASDNYGQALSAFTEYSHTVNAIPKNEFSSTSLKKIEQLEGILATLVLRFQVLLEKLPSFPKDK